MPLRGLSVLVVEDDRAHRELAQDMLTALGARVTVATNGEEAFALLIAGGCPDLILCDLRMPLMDGFGFAHVARKYSTSRNVRLVALTAIRDPVASLQTWSAGYDAHLEKPLTVEKLEDLAARLLSDGAASGAPTT
jgi:two-component system CheB/CheR fusion protein